MNHRPQTSAKRGAARSGIFGRKAARRRYRSGVAAELGLTIVYEDGDDGWIVASIPQISGVHSQGRTREEARENVIDALRLMLSPEPPPAGDERERERLNLTIAA